MFTELLRRATTTADQLLAPHGVDRYVEIVAPTFSTTEVRGRVTAAHRQTPDTVTLTVRPNRNWSGFEAGQHTQLTVEIAGVRHTRCYSMAGSAHDPGEFELTVKAHPGGLVSRHLVDHAHPGMVVGLTPAQGDFTLPAARPDRLLLISGGSGITPVLSMLRTLCAEGHTAPVTFLHYALTAADALYAEDLAILAGLHPNVRLVRVFTDEPGAGDLDGFLTTEQLAAADSHWHAAETYVCGPAPLMDAARQIYDDAGVADRLHTEAFTLPQFLGEAGSVGGTLRFGATGRDVANDGRPVLLQAEDAGLTPASGCRMGICHTCVRPLRCGTVRNAVTGETTTEADVDIRICINVPVGDVEVDL
jgi:stearoyl-CoA 9-desaturase NADPH oxidoreductase